MPPTRIVSARHVRGLQVGRDNVQLNHFEYRIENCHVDLGAALSTYAVHQQLRLLAADPDNAQLRRRADAELRRGRFFTKKATHRVTHRATTTVQDADDDAFETFLFVQNSSGVQVGNMSRQENFFFYVIAPTLDATELLRSDDQLRASIIEQVCSSSSLTGGTDLPQRLTTALERAVCALPDLRTSGTLMDLRRHQRVDIRDKDGVSIGVRGRQTNDVTAQVALQKRLITDVASVTSEHRQSVGQELARSIVNALRNASRSDEYSALITALKKTSPIISMKSIRWLSPSELRKLEKALAQTDVLDLRSVLAALARLQSANRAPSRSRPSSHPGAARQVDGAFFQQPPRPPASSARAYRGGPHPAAAADTVTPSRPTTVRHPGDVHCATSRAPDVTVETRSDHGRPWDARQSDSVSDVRHSSVDSRAAMGRQPRDVAAMTPNQRAEHLSAPAPAPGAQGRNEASTVRHDITAELATNEPSHFVTAPSETGGRTGHLIYDQLTQDDRPTEAAPVAGTVAEWHSPIGFSQPAIEQPARTPFGVPATDHLQARIEAAPVQRSEGPEVALAPQVTVEGSLPKWRAASPAVNVPSEARRAPGRRGPQTPLPDRCAALDPWALIERHSSAPCEMPEAGRAVEHIADHVSHLDWPARPLRHELEGPSAINRAPEAEPTRSPHQLRGIGGIG